MILPMVFKLDKIRYIVLETCHLWGRACEIHLYRVTKPELAVQRKGGDAKLGHRLSACICLMSTTTKCVPPDKIKKFPLLQQNCQEGETPTKFMMGIL